MSEGNLELSRRAADVFNERDLDAFLALQHEESEAEALGAAES